MSVLASHRCAEAASTSPRCLASQRPGVARALPRARRGPSPVSCLNPRKQHHVNAAAALPYAPATTVTPTTAPRPTSAGGAPGSGLGADIIGLGQGIVDWSASVSDSLLNSFDVPKGGRRVITVDERAAVMETLDEMGAPSQVSAGGSLANTLVGVARLSRASGQALRVALGGSLGTDTLGQFFTSQMRHAGVRCVLDSHHPPHAHGEAQDRPSMPEVASMQHQAPGPSGHTGTVMVLTTPDAQRSFLSFFAADRLELSERLRAAVRSSRMVVLEGYLWELPGAEEYMMEVLRTARAAGAQVAMTAGDPGVVSRHRAAMLRVVRAGIDMLFTNEDEAVALVGSSPSAPSSEGEEALVSVEDAAALAAGGRSGVELAALQLAAVCPMVVVTAGSKGSFVAAMGQLHEVPPYWLPQGPVDTCGAGDAYMAGFCYAVLAGYDLRTAGEFASRTASAVIGRFGPHLSDEDAELLVAQLPEHTGALRVALGGAGAVELGAGEFEGL